MQQEVIDILEKISKEKGIPFEVVKAVFLSQFQVVRKTITSADIIKEDFLNVRLKHLGLIYGNVNFMKRVNEYRGTGSGKYSKKKFVNLNNEDGRETSND